MPRIKRRIIVDKRTGKKRKTKTWYAWVPDGRGGTHLVSTKCTDRLAAEARAAELERDAADPTRAASRTATTQRILDDYQRNRATIGRSKATLEFTRKKSGVLLSLLPKLAADITHATLTSYAETRLSEGVMRTTVRKELGVLAPALRLAKRHGLWAGDADTVIPELDNDYRPRERWLTPWELVALCATLPTWRAAHVAFIVSTGARWGESARAEAIDIDAHLVRLRGTKTKAAARVVPVPPPFRKPLEWAIANAPGDGKKLFQSWSNVRRDLADACKKIGIAAVSPNDLRRTFSKWLRNAGVEPQLIGVAMGHTTSRMVELVYGRMDTGALSSLLEERLPDPLAHARLMSGSAGETEIMAESTENANAAKTAVNACAGTESNRRHGDFQSTCDARSLSRDVSEIATTCSANVRDDTDELRGLPPTLSERLRSSILAASSAVASGDEAAAVRALADGADAILAERGEE